VISRFRPLLTALALLIPWRSSSSQSWRTVESARQLHDSAAHHVRIRFGAGRIEVGATNAPLLYSMTLRYDESSSSPLHAYDPEARSLTLGLDAQKQHFSRNMDEKTKAEMRVSFNRGVPLDLDLDLGATKATLDLGGLNLVGLRLDSGASETLLDFSAPNRAQMRTMDVDVGAASFEARNLANANAASIHVQGGVGSVELDFGGQWSQDVAADVDLSLGKLTLHVPRDVGVRVQVEKFLASFDQQGLKKRGDAYYSDNWDQAKYHLRLRAETTLGGIELDRPN